MPVVSLKETLDRAFAERYGVPAINIINDLSIDAVLAAAVEENSPVILQTSVKTVVMYGRDQLYGIFTAIARDCPVPVTCTWTTARSARSSPTAWTAAGTPCCSTRTSSMLPRTSFRQQKS